MEILNIDGTALPAPSAYKVQLSDLDSSGTGRTEDGVLVRERVRGGVAKISAGWAALSTADCAKVLNATAPDSMTVQYFFWRRAHGEDVRRGPHRRPEGRPRRAGRVGGGGESDRVLMQNFAGGRGRTCPARGLTATGRLWDGCGRGMPRPYLDVETR